MEKINAVFTQRSDADGLTRAEIAALLEHLNLDGDEEVYPLVVNGDSALAFGFIRNETVSCALGDDIGETSPFVTELLAVVNDANLEKADHLYHFAGVNTLMYY